MNIGGEIDDCKNLTKPRVANYILAYVIYHII